MTPFSIVYGNYDFIKTNNIEELIKLYVRYQDLVNINNIDYKKNYLPAIIVDVDDDNFKIVDAYGKDINKINGYINDTILKYEDIELPAKKSDYEELYSKKGTIIYIYIVASFIKYTKLFKEDNNYIVFNNILLKRLEKFLNILQNIKLSNYEGSVSEVGDNYVKIKDSDDNEYTITDLNKDLIFVKENDNVKIGDYIEKNTFIDFDTKIIISHKIKPNFNTNYLLPLEKIQEVNNV